MTILTLQHVSKRFGSKQVLKDLNLTLPTGSIYGFVGENGAGKTTTMKLILGLVRADQGRLKSQANQFVLVTRQPIASLVIYRMCPHFILI